MNDPLDVDTERYVTLTDAMRLTRRSRPTIIRWVKAGAVRTLRRDGVRGYHLDDLIDAEAKAHTNQARTREHEDQR